MFSRRAAIKGAPGVLGGAAIAGSQLAAEIKTGGNESANAGRLIRSANKYELEAASNSSVFRAHEAFRQLTRKEKNPTQFTDRRREYMQTDPNVIALRSVSTQHQIHMLIDSTERKKQLEESWFKSLARRAGLAEDQIYNW